MLYISEYLKVRSYYSDIKQWFATGKGTEAYRPLALLGSGVPAASMFCEHLADADDAALTRLVVMCLLRRHPFGGLFLLWAGAAPISKEVMYQEFAFPWCITLFFPALEAVSGTDVPKINQNLSHHLWPCTQ